MSNQGHPLFLLSARKHKVCELSMPEHPLNRKIFSVVTILKTTCS